MSNEQRVQDLGEQELLKRLYVFCPSDVVGDDAALLTIAAGHSLVVTTDMLVDRVHFSDRTTTPADVGWRATAANLSDLAAMGATALGITIALGLPGDLPVAWVEQFYQGVVQCLEPFAAPIVGGDICRSSVTTVSITALGQVVPDRAIKRSHAQPGYAVLVTGAHGASRAGLELLLHPKLGQNLTDVDRSRFIAAHQRPKPRLDVIPGLWQVIEKAEGRGQQAEDEMQNSPNFPVRHLEPYAIAGMDTSDGLADAVLQMCRASGVGAQLEWSQIPLPAGITNWLSEEQAIDWALYGGEDFELVLGLPFEIAQEIVKQIEGAAIVGSITEEPIVVLKDSSGRYPDEILSLDKGFQHF